MPFGDAQSFWLAPLVCIISFVVLAIGSRKLPYQGGIHSDFRYGFRSASILVSTE